MKISIRNLWSLMCILALLAAEVGSANTLPTLTAGMIGKVTYLLGQAEITTADGSVSPLVLQMEIPDGSRITVKERSRVSLLMVDGGIEKLGADTVFAFNKYTYDPDNPDATEIRKTLLDGEVTSTTGRGGEDAKERYRMNSPLAAIAVLGTEYTVKVSKGETWVTVLSGEISIAKLGGSCQRSGLGACAGGERLSEGQRGLALVVRANEPKPILMPATAIPTSETKAEVPAPPVKEAEKESTKEPEKSQQVAAAEKAAEPEPQKSTPTSTPAVSTNQQDNTVATPALASLASTAPTTEKPPVASESTAVSAAKLTPSLPSVILESATSSFTASTASPTQQQETPKVSNTKVKQSLVQSSNGTITSPATLPVPEKVSVATVVPKTPVIESVPEKPKEATLTVVVPPVAPSVVEPVLEKPIVAVVTTMPAVVQEPPVPTVNWGKYDPAASVNGEPSFSEQVDSSYTQLLQPVNASPSNAILQQNPSVSLPEPDKRDVGVALDNAVAPVTTPAVSVAEAAPATTTVSNADVSKTTPLSSSTGTFRDDSTTPQTPLMTAPLTAAPLTTTAPLTAAPLTAGISTGLSVLTPR